MRSILICIVRDGGGLRVRGDCTGSTGSTRAPICVSVPGPACSEATVSSYCLAGGTTWGSLPFRDSGHSEQTRALNPDLKAPEPCPNRLEASQLPRHLWGRKLVTDHKDPMPPRDMAASDSTMAPFHTFDSRTRLMRCTGTVVIWLLSLCTVGTWHGGVFLVGRRWDGDGSPIEGFWKLGGRGPGRLRIRDPTKAEWKGCEMAKQLLGLRGKSHQGSVVPKTSTSSGVGSAARSATPLTSPVHQGSMNMSRTEWSFSTAF